MAKFTPIDGAPYRYDYRDFFKGAAAGRFKRVPAYREMCKKDLFFLLYFGLGREDLNHPFIVQAIREVEEDHDGTLDLWAREHYKLLSNKTKVLTPFGWTTHGELKPGDWVFAPDGRPVRVLAVTGDLHDPNMYHVRIRNAQRSEYEVFHAGADHLWDVEYFDRRRISGTKRRIGWTHLRLSTKELIRYTRAQQEVKNPRWYRIGYTAPLHFPEKDLPVPPYILGAWLGDGSSGTSNITNGNDQLWERICGEGYRISRDKAPHRDNTQVRTVYSLWPALKKLGYCGCKSNTKYIPLEYLTASLEQRTELMQGLMDSDGSVMQRGVVAYTTTSERLAQDVAALARTFGVVATAKEYWGTYNGEPYRSYRVTFVPRADVNFFSLDYHNERLNKFGRQNQPAYWYITDVSPADTVPSQCIQVEGGRYLAGERLVPTHNSTIITYGLPIQEIIRNPEERIAIFSHTRPIAKGFLRNIKLTLEGNPPVKRWFPDIFWAMPKRQAPKWSEDDGLIVKRKSFANESTLEAWGLVDGQPTSKHFTIRIYDDVVTRESVTTPEQIQKTQLAYELSESLGTEGGHKRVCGTHYSFADAYMTMRKKLIASGNAAKIRIKPATHDGTSTGDPVLLSEARLKQLLIDQGPYIFSCQQLLNPTAGANTKFMLSWLKYYDRRPVILNKYILCDPASEKKKTSDYTVLVCIGIDVYKNRYLLAMVRDRLDLGQRWQALKKMWIKHRPLATGYEKYGKDSDIEYFEQQMEREQVRFHITPLGGQVAKNDRIGRLVPRFKNGQIFLPRHLPYIDAKGEETDLIQVFIEEEYQTWPFSVHDDMLDTLARIEEKDMHVTAPVSGQESRLPPMAETAYNVI